MFVEYYYHTRDLQKYRIKRVSIKILCNILSIKEHFRIVYRSHEDQMKSYIFLFFRKLPFICQKKGFFSQPTKLKG